MNNRIPTVSRTTYIPPSRLDSLEADGFDYADIHGLHWGFRVFGIAVVVGLVGCVAAIVLAVAT